MVPTNPNTSQHIPTHPNTSQHIPSAHIPTDSLERFGAAEGEEHQSAPALCDDANDGHRHRNWIILHEPHTAGGFKHVGPIAPPIR